MALFPDPGSTSDGWSRGPGPRRSADWLDEPPPTGKGLIWLAVLVIAAAVVALLALGIIPAPASGGGCGGG